MVPEAVAMLAAPGSAPSFCRFAGFSPEPGQRIIDCDSTLVITADQGCAAARYPLKTNVDEALRHCTSVGASLS
jgi:acetyl-CoA synthetase